MLFVDTARPVSRESVLKGLRFSDSVERIVCNRFYQKVNPANDLAVGLQPVLVILPSTFGEDQFHSVDELPCLSPTGFQLGDGFDEPPCVLGAPE